jgi:hypothetical protein
MRFEHIGDFIMKVLWLTLGFTVALAFLIYATLEINWRSNTGLKASADEAGWFTIASKPIWNEKAQLWEVTCYLSRTPVAETPADWSYTKRMELPVVLAICSPDNNVGYLMKFLDKGDKAYLLYPKVQGTSVYFVGNIKTAKEYRRDNMKIPGF